MLKRQDLRKTICCILAWPYDAKDAGRLAGWPAPMGAVRRRRRRRRLRMPSHPPVLRRAELCRLMCTQDYKLERFEVEERENVDPLVGKCLEDKIVAEIFEECRCVCHLSAGTRPKLQLGLNLPWQ
eukprot:SAG11_NODE_340_length_10476_cov_6.009155_6_plen_126_part_00